MAPLDRPNASLNEAIWVTSIVKDSNENVSHLLCWHDVKLSSSGPHVIQLSLYHAKT